MRSFASVPVVVNAVNDTLIFLAISYNIISHPIVGNTWHARAKSFFVAGRLPRMSRGLLQGGQLFYFVTIGFSIATATLILSTNTATVYRSMLTVPNVALENAMACRVYRAVKLGFIRNPHSASRFESSLQSNLTPGHELTVKQPTLHESQVNLDVTRITADDYALGKQPSLIEKGSELAYDRV